MSTSAHSVVKIIPATEAAFSNATLVTFFGSIIPASNKSTYCSDLASYPKPSLPSIIFATTTEPSPPAFATIVLTGASRALEMI